MKKHKYFRDLDYKNKLETRYNNTRGRYSSTVFFLTEDVDPRFIREEWHHVLKNSSNTYRAQYLYGKADNYDRYMYWDRPEVEYTVHEYLKKKRLRQTFFKKYDNRVYRRKLNLCHDILPSGGDYKRYTYSYWH